MHFLQGSLARDFLLSFIKNAVGEGDSWSIAGATEDEDRPELAALLLRNRSGLVPISRRTVDISTSFAFARARYADQGCRILVSRILPVAAAVVVNEEGEYFAKGCDLGADEAEFCDFLETLGVCLVGSEIARADTGCFDSCDQRFLTVFEILFEWWEDTSGQYVPYASR